MVNLYMHGYIYCQKEKKTLNLAFLECIRPSQCGRIYRSNVAVKRTLSEDIEMTGDP